MKTASEMFGEFDKIRHLRENSIILCKDLVQNGFRVSIEKFR